MSASNPAPLNPVVQAEDVRRDGLEAHVGPLPLVLEIGFGRADLLIALGLARPGCHLLGVEVSRKRVEKAGRRLIRHGVQSVRLVHAPAEYLLARVLPPASIGECWINCPDPWPKKRHHRRRLIQPQVIRPLGRVLRPGADLHISTDHVGYAEWISKAMAEVPIFRNLHAPEPWSGKPPDRPVTAYEAEWIAEGRRILYFDYVREPGPVPEPREAEVRSDRPARGTLVQP